MAITQSGRPNMYIRQGYSPCSNMMRQLSAHAHNSGMRSKLLTNVGHQWLRMPLASPRQPLTVHRQAALPWWVMVNSRCMKIHVFWTSRHLLDIHFTAEWPDWKTTCDWAQEILDCSWVRLVLGPVMCIHYQVNSCWTMPDWSDDPNQHRLQSIPHWTMSEG